MKLHNTVSLPLEKKLFTPFLYTNYFVVVVQIENIMPNDLNHQKAINETYSASPLCYLGIVYARLVCHPLYCQSCSQVFTYNLRIQGQPILLLIQEKLLPWIYRIVKSWDSWTGKAFNLNTNVNNLHKCVFPITTIGNKKTIFDK